jgi:hypothetical protein
MIDKSSWHMISGINKANKKSQHGICSICGPSEIGYDSWGDKFRCNNKRNKSLAERKASDPSFKTYVQKQKQEYRWKSVYKLTADQVFDMLVKQNNQCAICFSSISLITLSQDSLHIDHDHKCCLGGNGANAPLCGNCNRGLLCSRCNLAIGNFNDDIELMKNAIAYLEKYNS